MSSAITVRRLEKQRGSQEHRVLQKAKAPFHPALAFVGGQEVFGGELFGVQFVGRQDEPAFLRDARFAGRETRGQSAADLIGEVVGGLSLSGSPGPMIVGHCDDFRPLHGGPLQVRLECRECVLSIGSTSKVPA